MIHDIFMPALSSTMTEGKIVEWTKAPGDKVEKGETVVIVESDKADMDVESFNEGYLAVVLVEAGNSAPVGNAIAYLASTEAEIAEAQKKAASGGSVAPPAQTESQATTAATTTTATTPAKTVAASNGNGRIVASPRARKLAKEYKVDLKTLQGSGPYGRIIAADVESAAGQPVTESKAIGFGSPVVSQPIAVTQPTVTTPQSTPTPVNTMAGETVPLNTLQKAVVQNMNMSLQIPTFHVGYTIATDALDKLYKQIKPKGVTMTALLAKAVAVTLQKHPVVNASYAPDAIKYNSDINIAVAVAMPDGGLITPVLRNADRMDIYSLSRTWKDLVNRARAKQLQPDEYSTGTFTLSNLGMFGVDTFDAILPSGQGSILAIAAACPQVIANDAGMMGVQQQMKVNITSDHRIIYGAQAAAFLKDLALLIETDAQSLTL
ncbi:Dihydrolipoamide acetyltransferase component of pyruvate dehydrogenase complex [Hyella patelloides LEGE 07179]|uniref:Dihydrolipoamide acetyltransferase component of pyruvate dehydrogenase complex n=1 Tax=Hyella patelloides LEGE 07179 TaxID=945734 RepID=A0A563W0N0_9CYAN|nr:dihydrolipoamide acetyltransferase family protein [Hyella patelloides]VEP17272.1 Dihydrolipoamide acetyltransferase component of pyruvate dehydrogenase complex [Hyella patelloides LEGE 07179]